MSEATFWRMEAERHDPFATIPNADDGEYAGTILETTRERQHRTASTPEEGE